MCRLGYLVLFLLASACATTARAAQSDWPFMGGSVDVNSNLSPGCGVTISDLGSCRIRVVLVKNSAPIRTLEQSISPSSGRHVQVIIEGATFEFYCLQVGKDLVPHVRYETSP